ncbi:MAG: hypothetical protein ACTHKQ_03645 [Mesorhizobium sp.]
MKYRLLAALMGMALAGCTSQQQQPNLSYSTTAEPLPPPAMAATQPVSPQSVQAMTLPTPASPAVPAQTVTAAGFPAPPACDTGSLELSCAPAMQEKKCRTVGNVTTCDVPADPDADNRLYTN